MLEMRYARREGNPAVSCMRGESNRKPEAAGLCVILPLPWPLGKGSERKGKKKKKKKNKQQGRKGRREGEISMLLPFGARH